MKGGPLGPSLATALHALRLWGYPLLDKALKLLMLRVESNEYILLDNYSRAFLGLFPK
jgi:hypothetical protein